MSDFSSAFPNSQQIYVDANGASAAVRVPMRQIALDHGRQSIRVYDTSGPQGHDVAAGLPKMRERWLKPRAPGEPVTQLYYARKGEITPEM
jgi:phosphomethylpyrimidine synthase